MQQLADDTRAHARAVGASARSAARWRPSPRRSCRRRTGQSARRCASTPRGSASLVERQQAAVASLGEDPSRLCRRSWSQPARSSTVLVLAIGADRGLCGGYNLALVESSARVRRRTDPGGPEVSRSRLLGVQRRSATSGATTPTRSRDGHVAARRRDRRAGGRSCYERSRRPSWGTRSTRCGRATPSSSRRSGASHASCGCCRSVPRRGRAPRAPVLGLRA